MRWTWQPSTGTQYGRTCLVSMVIWTLIFPPTLFTPQRVLAAFVDASNDRLPTTSDATNSFATGDVDGDGDTDVVVVNAGQLSLLFNDGHGRFAAGSADHLPTLPLTAMAATLGDVDGDGDLDLVLANVRGPNPLLLNDGHGVFSVASGAQLPPSTQATMSVQLGDVDGDGDLDLVVANRGSQNRLYRNDGHGMFTDVTTDHLPVDTALSYDVELADIDGDGRLDLVVANQGTPNRLLRNNGLGVFTDVTAAQLPMDSGASIDALFADVDADGDPDLLIAAGAIPLRLLLNDGTGRFTDATATHIPALNAFGIKVLAGDVDGDGGPDLVVAAAGQDHVLLNDGTGRFTDATATLLPVDTRRSFGLALLDVDQDLDFDLLLGTPGGPNRLLLNVLTWPRLRLATFPAYKEVDAPVTLTAEAFDEDGLHTASLAIVDPSGEEQRVDLLTALAAGQATHTFTPTIPGVYTATLTAVDTQGEAQSRHITFPVHSRDNTAPQVALAVENPAPLVVGQPVRLRVSATDEQGGVRTHLVVQGASVPLDSTGLATYLAAMPGSYTVLARATDAAGNTGTAETTLIVEADTVPPLVQVGVAPQEVPLTQPVTITVETTDNVAITARTLRVTGPAIPDGLPLTLEATGHAIYTPFQPGTYTLVATAHDPSGNTGTATATFTATGVPDTVPPVVQLAVVPATVAIGNPVTLSVTATDTVEVTQTTLEINDTPQPLDATGSVTYTPSLVGTYTAMAVARDATGNTGSALRTFRVIDPAADTAPPLVSISTPAAHATLSVPTAIIGNVRDDTLVRYTLAYAPRGTDAFTTFASGTTEVIDGVLGTLDTSLLLNDLYDIRLTAEDARGRITSTTVVYQVTGALKVGHFSLMLEDLTIPAVGLPITITRTYDSREKRQGDFGVGWRLGVHTMTLRKNRVLGTGWQQVTGDAGLVNYYCVEPVDAHVVSVTLPDGRVETFDFLPETPKDSRTGVLGTLPQNCQFAVPVQFATSAFTPRPGTQARLESLAVNNLMIVGAVAGAVDILPQGDVSPYDPSRYRLTTAEGMVVDLDEDFGVRSLTEPNGNTLTFGTNGVVHSAGTSVAFTRDAQGRITQMTDPNGNAITYAYDANGNLIAVTAQEGYTTRYTYDAQHHLIAIADPRGITPARNIYDDAGRLIAHVDAEGHRIEYTHDVEGRQEIVRDRLGHVTVYTYDDAGNVLSQTNALGHTTTFTYDEQGNELIRTDALNRTITRTYNTHGKALTLTDPLDNTMAWAYDDHNRLLMQTDAEGYRYTYTYDTLGNPLTIADPMGEVTSHSYNTQGNRVTTTNPLGPAMPYQYDTIGRRIEARNAVGATTTWSYDANGNRLSETTTRTDGQGHLLTVTTRWIYDQHNRIIGEIDPLGHQTSVEYNAIGKEAVEIDKNGNRIEYAYDSMGNLVRTRYPDNTEEIATYDANGNRLSWTDRAGRTTVYTYDALDRLVQTAYPDGSNTRMEYDAAGQLIASTDASGNRTTYHYDATGRRTAVIDALGQATAYMYDARSNLTSVTDAQGHTSIYTYDALNRRIKTTFPDGTTQHVQYDAMGRKIAETDQAGVVAMFTYDAVGRLLTVTDALGEKTTFTYDEVGNKLAQTDANGQITRWTYDHLGRVTSRFLPMGMTETFTYDANGNMRTHTDFNGQTTTYTYEVNDRLITTQYPDGRAVHTTYTPTGQVATVTDQRGITTYSYDLRDRLLGVVHPDGATIAYTYDAMGNRNAITTPAGTTQYTYDPLYRLQTVTSPRGEVTTYSYDSVGNRVRVTFPNGTSTYYAYDALNRLTELEHRRPDGNALASYAYTLDATGNRLGVVEHDGRTVTYHYDALSRLVQEDIIDPLAGQMTINSTYNAVGNRLTQTVSGVTTLYTYDTNDRLVQSGNTIYTYDANGNMVRAVAPTGPTHYAYDAENRLMTVVTPHHTVHYTYDADGVRVSTTQDGVLTSYLVDTQRSYTQVVEERDSSGTLMAHYVSGDTLLSQERDSTTTYYHVDGLGSTRVLTDDAAAVTATYTYDAFGNELASSGTTENPYRFTGEPYDPVAQAYYLRARYYHPATGRFLTMDTFPGRPQEPLSLHKYLYAHANPVTFTDPSGHFSGNINDVLAATTIRSSTLAQIAVPRFFDYTIRAAAVAFVVSMTVCVQKPPIFMGAELGTPCDEDERRFPVFRSGKNIRETTAHISSMLQNKPQLSILNKDKAHGKWYNKIYTKECNKAERSKFPEGSRGCDEYPFNSTLQGGPENYKVGNVSLRLVPISEVKSQGRSLDKFYNTCKISNYDSSDPYSSIFGVITSQKKDTGFNCNKFQ